MRGGNPENTFYILSTSIWHIWLSEQYPSSDGNMITHERPTWCSSRYAWAVSNLKFDNLIYTLLTVHVVSIILNGGLRKNGSPCGILQVMKDNIKNIDLYSTLTVHVVLIDLWSSISYPFIFMVTCTKITVYIILFMF